MVGVCILQNKDFYNKTPARDIDIKRNIALNMSKGSLFGDNEKLTKVDEEDRTKEFIDSTSYENISVSTDIDPINKKSVKRISILKSLPKMRVPDFYNKNVLLELNFNLPTKDILSKVEYLKKAYDKHNKLIPLDIEIIELNFNEKTKIKSIKRDRLKLADDFYMFDYFITTSKNEPNMPYESIYIDIEFQKINQYKARGIMNTIDRMKNYIYKMHYKQLLTQI